MWVDNSQLSTFIGCPKKYENKYRKCLLKADLEGNDMDIKFGSAIHAGLEEFYRNGCTKEAMESGRRVFANQFDDYPGEDVKTALNGNELLTQYESYHNNNFKNWEILQCEETNTFEIVDGIKYICKIDLVIKMNNNIYVVDFKTSTTKNRQKFLSDFDMSRQAMGYIEWCKRKYGECSGFIPVALFLGFRKRSTTRNGVHFPEGFWFEPDYTIVNKTSEQLEDFISDTIFWISQLSRAKSEGYYPRNTDSCSAWRGCQFKGLCESLDDETVQSTLYSEINPFEYLGGEYGKKENYL